MSKKEKAFKKPTIEEISAYCKERNNSIDPQMFYDFYESKGWMVGKNKMKDWKAACRTWESKRKEEYPSLFSQQEQEPQASKNIEWE